MVLMLLLLRLLHLEHGLVLLIASCCLNLPLQLALYALEKLSFFVILNERHRDV